MINVQTCLCLLGKYLVLPRLWNSYYIDPFDSLAKVDVAEYCYSIIDYLSFKLAVDCLSRSGREAAVPTIASVYPLHC